MGGKFDIAGQSPLSPAEMRKEESRHMVWNAMLVLAMYATKEAEFDEGSLPLYIIDPLNASVLW